MTCTVVSSGTHNPTIPHHTVLADVGDVNKVLCCLSEADACLSLFQSGVDPEPEWCVLPDAWAVVRAWQSGLVLGTAAVGRGHEQDAEQDSCSPRDPGDAVEPSTSRYSGCGCRHRLWLTDITRRVTWHNGNDRFKTDSRAVCSTNYSSVTPEFVGLALKCS